MRIHISLPPAAIDIAARIIAEHRAAGLRPYAVDVEPDIISVQSGVSPADFTHVRTTASVHGPGPDVHMSSAGEYFTVADAAAAVRAKRAALAASEAPHD